MMKSFDIYDIIYSVFIIFISFKKGQSMDENHVIKNIKKLAEKMGKTPSVNEYQTEYGSTSFYKVRYNSLIVKAGLKPNIAYNKDFIKKSENHLKKKKELKEEFLQIYKRLKFVPTKKEINECGISSEVIRYYFGTYKGFLKEVGVTKDKDMKSPKVVEKNFNREVILKQIKELATKLKKIPTKEEYEEKYGKIVGLRQYGGFSSLLELASPILEKKEISKIEVEDSYLKYIKENGIPSEKDLPKALPQLKIIKKYFKNFKNLLTKIGYIESRAAFWKMSQGELISFLQKSVDSKVLKAPKDFNLNFNLPFWETVKSTLKCETFDEMADIIDRQELNEIRYNKYTRKEVVMLYKRLSDKLGKMETGATIRDLELHHRLNSYYISELFGGLNELRMALGYKVGEQEIKATVFNKEEIKKILKRKIKIRGRNLKIREIEEIPELPSLPTIYKIFEVNKIKELYVAIEE